MDPQKIEFFTIFTVYLRIYQVIFPFLYAVHVNSDFRRPVYFSTNQKLIKTRYFLASYITNDRHSIFHKKILFRLLISGSNGPSGRHSRYNLPYRHSRVNGFSSHLFRQLDSKVCRNL